MVELFTAELNKSGDQKAFSESNKDCSLKCFEEAFAFASAEKNQPNKKDITPVKDVPGATLESENNQYYLNYRGDHLPTWTAKNPDGSATKPFVDANGKARVDGKLQAVTDDKGRVLGTDGKPVLDADGMRRYNSDATAVSTKFESSDPGEMKKALSGLPKQAFSDENRSSFNKMIESADKLDRVEMARAIEAHEKWTMSHTTAYLWETGYRQAQQKAYELSKEIGQNPVQSRVEEYNKVMQQLKAKDEELKQKPVLAEQVKVMREANASDDELGRLLSSPIETRSFYLNKLLEQDDVKKYASTADKNSPVAKSLESSANLQEARRMVAELIKINPDFSVTLDSAAKALGMGNSKKN